MRKIINNRVYDTGSAKKVGDYETEVDGGSYVFGGLYCKRTGEYFAETDGTVLGMVATITPLSYDEAREWAETHLTAERYEAEFGTPDEGETAVLSLTVPAATYRAVKSEAARRGCPMRDLVVEWAETLGGDGAR
jgi:hypothetical protein